MLTFAAAVFLLIVTPGPGVLSTAGVGAAHGFRAGLRYVIGLFIGTNLVALAVISGLAAVVVASVHLRLILSGVSALYLLYLAARIAFAGADVGFIPVKGAPGIRAGLILQAVNPKAYVVNTALFTGFAFHPENLAVETALKLVIVNTIWIAIHLAWLQAGAVLHRLDLSPTTHQRINYAMAGALLLFVVLAASALFDSIR